MSEPKPVTEKKQDELPEAELEVISGGLNPQPLPPGRFTPSNQF